MSLSVTVIFSINLYLSRKQQLCVLFIDVSYNFIPFCTNKIWYQLPISCVCKINWFLKLYQCQFRFCVSTLTVVSYVIFRWHHKSVAIIFKSKFYLNSRILYGNEYSQSILWTVFRLWLGPGKLPFQEKNRSKIWIFTAHSAVRFSQCILYRFLPPSLYRHIG